ncbi:WD40 repeat-like protein [Lophium mytilinum]|uniref:WD40 repeat-like protein n=1 Tax=Lophium mytilinum TaxID=390894 RepID=A0A6A6QBD4_9PEZI|nr:WD40 repeat-like protein [Lophium mytilinum]
MPTQRAKSFLSHRPKTSSAADDGLASQRAAPVLKKTASQTFSTYTDAKDVGPQLERVSEDRTIVDFDSTHPTVFSSVKQMYRRLSSSSKKRPPPSELGDSADSAMSKFRRSSHDSEMLDVSATCCLMPQSQTQSGSRLTRRFGSMRYRRQATSGPAGDAARYNPGPPPMPTNYAGPPFIPTDSSRGSAARAAAAAQNERLSLSKQARRDAEVTAKFLSDGDMYTAGDDVSRDNESGVGMTCSSPIEGREYPIETRHDPIQYLPAELSTMILSNLTAATLAQTEVLSKAWRAAASSTYAWRAVFLRRFELENHVSPTPIMMGGAGVGKKNGSRFDPGQKWKQMYQVRCTLERRWAAGTPNAIYLNGHTDSVYCCQFDENKIITGSRDRTIRVWDLKTFECLKVIGGPANLPVASSSAPLDIHANTVLNPRSVNGTPEGRKLYSVPTDYHEASILCLQFDSKIMVTGSSDHTCIVWDISGEDYIPKYRLRRHTAGVLDVCLDDKYIISCSKDATINVWDRQTGTHVKELTGHQGPVNAVQLRGNLLVSASGDGIAKLWNLDSGTCIKDFKSQDRGLAAVEFSDDAKYVLAGGNDHVVYKFDTTTGQLLHTSSRHGGLVRSLFLDAHNNRVISGSYDQSIRISHYDSGETFGTYKDWTTSWILSAKSDYRRVVATSQDGRVVILDFGWGVDDVHLLEGR